MSEDKSSKGTSRDRDSGRGIIIERAVRNRTGVKVE